VNYLGLDFGTSNCVACAPDDTGAITFVPLEGDSTLLPTVLFVNRAIIAGVEIDENELDKRVKDALEENRRNQTRILAAFEEELITFDDRYKPKTPCRYKKPN
jgi:molecular chaperone DnaK (HSP70)